jgi:4-hydroxy-tetrahydrodipicolinate synthase
MFDGVLTALVTPFRDDAIDESALRGLVDRQIDAGVDGLVPCGSTGESATLSHAEHRRVVEIVVQAARGRVPVVAGAGSNSTREAIELTGYAKEAGADGALLISPYYNTPTQEGIFLHYAAIARTCAFPLVVYNVPGRTASNIAPATVARIADLEQVVGIKEACGDLAQISELTLRCPAGFRVLSGDDALTLPILAIGGHGVISTTSNLAPAEMVALVRSFRAGDLAAAQRAHQRLLPLFDVLFCETNPIPLKAALAMLGAIGPEIRLPMTPLTEPSRERLGVVLKELGLAR